MKNMEQNYLEQLSVVYPTIEKASAEIINLQSILNLPKGTEHFLSDIHGEYEAFSHVLRNGSGAVSKKIDDVFEYDGQTGACYTDLLSGREDGTHPGKTGGY